MVKVPYWKLKSHLFKVLVLGTFTYGTKLWRGDLKNSYWKIFKKVMQINMMSHVKINYVAIYHILLAEFGGLPLELFVFMLTMGFQQQLAHLTSSWLVSEIASFSRHMSEQGFKTCNWNSTVINYPYF